MSVAVPLTLTCTQLNIVQNTSITYCPTLFLKTDESCPEKVFADAAGGSSVCPPNRSSKSCGLFPVGAVGGGAAAAPVGPL